MTTPKKAEGKASAPASPSKPKDHIARPEPQGQGPDRSGGAQTAKPSNDPKSSISENVAQIVRDAYEVISENIRQGRQAAEKFRQGEYHISEAPVDLETMSQRLLGLGREFSSVAFDICERVLVEMRGALSTDKRDDGLRPFRGTPAKGPASASKTDPGRLKLNVRFSGTAKAVAHTVSLERPKRPTAPDQIAVTPLTSRNGSVKPISGVRFEVDMAQEGLVAVVTVPARQPACVYSGLVYAGSEDVPLGALTIEIQE